MGIIKDNYESFIKDIEKNIKNEEDRKYVKKRMEEFLNVILDKMDTIMDYKEDEIKKMQETQENLEKKYKKMSEIIDKIEKDIYADEGFDFEIICPYCDYEFLIDDDENKKEVQCPNCKNIIDLEWNGEVEDNYQDCSGNCSSCGGCDIELDDEDDDDEDDDM